MDDNKFKLSNWYAYISISVGILSLIYSLLVRVDLKLLVITLLEPDFLPSTWSYEDVGMYDIVFVSILIFISITTSILSYLNGELKFKYLHFIGLILCVISSLILINLGFSLI